MRRNIEHYELVPLLKELIENGVLVEEHADKHEKADRVYRLFAAVSFNGESPIGVKLTLKKEKANYSLVDNGSTNIRIYDVQHIEKPVRRSQDHLISEFTHAGSDTGFSLSIAELLKDVKDNNGVPYINEDGTLNVNFVKNTDTFKQSAGEGARYNQSVRGQTRINGMSRVVSLFELADKSTFVHELGHVALADLKMLAEMEGAPAQLVRDWQTVKEWLGYKDSQGFTREQHEKFARGFEAYYLFSSLSFFLPKTKNSANDS